MPSPWRYDPATHTYRNTATGTVLSPRDMLVLRDRFITALYDETQRLAQALADRAISIPEWERRMRQLIKTTHIDEYVLGRGGRDQMRPPDWGRLGYACREQYAFLGDFADDIANGRYTDETTGGLRLEAIAARASLYVDAGRSSYERAKALSYGVPVRLPAYPGDGSTACLTRCACTWEIEATDEGWDCYWTLGPAEHCPDCLARAHSWNPYHVPLES